MQIKRLISVSCVLILLVGTIIGLYYLAGPARWQSMALAQEKQGAGNMSRAQMFNQQGTEAAQKGNYQEAIRHYDQALKIDPNNVNALNNRGVAYSKMGRYDRAISDYTKVLQLNPQFSQAYQNRSIAYFRQKNYSRACADLRKFREMGGNPSPEFVRDLEKASGTC